jgi:hypothetical protein
MSFKSVATAVALATASVAASPAHASWYDASDNCQTIEDIYKAWEPSLPAAHTPDDVIRDMGFVGGIQDVTAKFAAEAHTDIDPKVLRIVDFGGKHGIHMFLTDRRQCLGLAAAFASTAHQH